MGTKSLFDFGMGQVVVCELLNTGNGYIAKFPATTSVEQDYYVCLDYAQADDLFKALKIEFEDKKYIQKDHIVWCRKTKQWRCSKRGDWSFGYGLTPEEAYNNRLEGKDNENS